MSLPPLIAKRLSLTLLLTVGFTFQNCDICNCPKPKGDYFNINGISADSYRKRGTCCADKMGTGEEAVLSDHSLLVRYQYEYFSARQFSAPWAGISLLSSAAACDCFEDGTLGTKEYLRQFTVVTLNDFDAQHLANDTINDLLRIQTSLNNIQDLTDYLRTDTARIQQFSYTLYLRKRPTLQLPFAAKVSVTLQNGESYTATSLPVTIR